eukprot:SAG31_NODE_3180_length_4582_cov_2.985501_8_plen_165_part_00
MDPESEEISAEDEFLHGKAEAWELKEEADEMMHDGDYDDAAVTYGIAVELDPENDELRALQAEALLNSTLARSAEPEPSAGVTSTAGAISVEDSMPSDDGQGGTTPVQGAAEPSQSAEPEPSAGVTSTAGAISVEDSMPSDDGEDDLGDFQVCKRYKHSLDKLC